MYQISIEENIKRILKTRKFTKTLHPDFGLNSFIDKDMRLETLSRLKEDIITQLQQNEPRINLERVAYELIDEQIQITLNYTEQNKQNELKLRL